MNEAIDREIMKSHIFASGNRVKQLIKSKSSWTSWKSGAPKELLHLTHQKKSGGFPSKTKPSTV